MLDELLIEAAKYPTSVVTSRSAVAIVIVNSGPIFCARCLFLSVSMIFSVTAPQAVESLGALSSTNRFLARTAHSGSFYISD